MAHPPAFVDVRGLELRYGGAGAFRLAVPRFQVDAGTAAVLTGPSGSGKTTLLHALAGILVPHAGDVRVGDTQLVAAGTALGDAARRRFRIREVGLVFQAFELLDHLSVFENILLPYFINPALERSAEVDARARSLAERLGIAALLPRGPATLSQGERQRVAIARALVTAPSLVLADEPTGNLDPETTGTILALLLDEVRRHDATLLMVTHDHGLLGHFDHAFDMAQLCREPVA
jgi:ABC-type lipoprotein export system ATPase subunit